MAKKNVKVTMEAVNPTTVEDFTVEIPVTPKVGKLDLDFGREDLNKLRDKVNEIIDNI